MDESKLADRMISMQAENREFLLYCVDVLSDSMRDDGYIAEELEVCETDESYNAFISFVDANHNKRLAVEESSLPKYFIKKINVSCLDES